MDTIFDEATLHLLGLTPPAKKTPAVPRASASSLSEHTKPIESAASTAPRPLGRAESTHQRNRKTKLRGTMQSAHTTAPPIPRGKVQSAQIRAPIENKRTSSKFCFRTLIRIGLLFALNLIKKLCPSSNQKSILNVRFVNCIGFKKIILPTCSSPNLERIIQTAHNNPQPSSFRPHEPP